MSEPTVAYDYDLQVWVVDGLIKDCNHGAAFGCGCNGRKLAGTPIAEARYAAGLA